MERTDDTHTITDRACFHRQIRKEYSNYKLECECDFKFLDIRMYP